ncbi:hypothetical protein DPMN_035636 [Dreissena polymorpha]|uniref:Uncharacterized protein n=1 Tax=Dreissena polymorpha TaxID=45954 RepID=A0A9D4M7X8_DREPO|nr:hypothetical protein DPMN_035636 [Dreissena polymorpha]
MVVNTVASDKTANEHPSLELCWQHMPLDKLLQTYWIYKKDMGLLPHAAILVSGLPAHPCSLISDHARCQAT